MILRFPMCNPDCLEHKCANHCQLYYYSPCAGPSSAGYPHRPDVSDLAILLRKLCVAFQQTLSPDCDRNVAFVNSLRVSLPRQFDRCCVADAAEWTRTMDLCRGQIQTRCLSVQFA